MLFLSQLTIPYGISVLFVRISCGKYDHKDEAAKKIIIYHKYHN